MQNSDNTRWWESYLVRYGVGTIVGAICVYALLLALNEPKYLAKALMMPPVEPAHLAKLVELCGLEGQAWDARMPAVDVSDSPSAHISSQACLVHLQLYQDLYGSTWVQLLLLGVYGLGYCYIASAPGLVVHAVRRRLIYKKLADKQAPVAWRLAFWGGFAVIISAAAFHYLNCSDTYWLAAATLLFTFFCICWLLYWLRQECKEGTELLDFYRRLHLARKREKISLNSYRHLREHGNAFFIVVLELVLFAVCLSLIEIFGQWPYWPALLVIWIAPAALVYFTGHHIEALMVEKYGSKTFFDE